MAEASIEVMIFFPAEIVINFIYNKIWPLNKII